MNRVSNNSFVLGRDFNLLIAEVERLAKEVEKLNAKKESPKRKEKSNVSE